MIERPPLKLSDRQLRLVQRAAKAVPPGQRDQWLKNVAARLFDTPSDAALQASINIEYDRLSHASHAYLTDSKTSK